MPKNKTVPVINKVELPPVMEKELPYKWWLLVGILILLFMAGLLAWRWLYPPQAGASIGLKDCHWYDDGKCYNYRGYVCVHNGYCPTPTPTPTPEPTYHSVCRDNECVSVEGDGENECDLQYKGEENPCLVVTPTPVESLTPTPQPTGDPHVDSWTPSTPPACSDTAPEKAPCNFHVWRNGDTAVLRWEVCGSNPGNKVNAYYKQVSSGDWQYSVQGDNSGLMTINGLGKLDITFALQQVNGCAAGGLVSPLTNLVVDGASSGWHLFR